MRAKTLIPLLTPLLLLSACGGGGGSSVATGTFQMTAYSGYGYLALAEDGSAVLGRGNEVLFVDSNGATTPVTAKASDVRAVSPSAKYALILGTSTFTVLHNGTAQTFPCLPSPAAYFRRIDDEGNVYGIEDINARSNNQNLVLFRTKNGVDFERSSLPNGFYTGTSFGYFASKIPTIFSAGYNNASHIIEFRPGEQVRDLGGGGNYFGGGNAESSTLYQGFKTFAINTNNGNRMVGTYGGPYRVVEPYLIGTKLTYASTPLGFLEDGSFLQSDSSGGYLVSESSEVKRVYQYIQSPEYRYQINSAAAAAGRTIIVRFYDIEARQNGVAILRRN